MGKSSNFVAFVFNKLVTIRSSPTRCDDKAVSKDIAMYKKIYDSINVFQYIG